jgi:hypothetical protein
VKPKIGEMLKVVDSEDQTLVSTFWAVIGYETRRHGEYLHTRQVAEDGTPMADRRVFCWGGAR